MELFDRKSPAYTKVVTGVSQQTGITFHNGDIVEDVIVIASDLAIPPTPLGVAVAIDGEGVSDSVSYIAVTAYKLGLWSALSAEVVVDLLVDSTTAVISWNASLGASLYRVYSGVETGVYTGYIETDALSLELVGATSELGTYSASDISGKDVTFKILSNGSVLSTATISANDTPVKTNISFLAGKDTPTLYVTPEFGSIDIIVNYRPSQRLFDNASFGDGISLNYIQGSVIGTGGGTAQVQTVALPFILTELKAGMRFSYIASVSNTGAAPTINVNGLGAITAIRGIGGSVSTALVANDIYIALVVDCLYNGTNILIMNPQVA